MSTLDGQYLGHAAQAGNGEKYIRAFGVQSQNKQNNPLFQHPCFLMLWTELGNFISALCQNT